MTGGNVSTPAPRVQVGQLLRDRRVALRLGLGWLCERLRGEISAEGCVCGWIVAVEAGAVTPSSIELTAWAAALELPAEALYSRQAGEV